MRLVAKHISGILKGYPHLVQSGVHARRVARRTNNDPLSTAPVRATRAAVAPHCQFHPEHQHDGAEEQRPLENDAVAVLGKVALDRPPARSDQAHEQDACKPEAAPWPTAFKNYRVSLTTVRVPFESSR